MVKYGGGKVLSREPKPDIDESLCLPTTRESNKAPNNAVTLAPIAFHANPSSKQYRCTQYVIYDSLAEKKPHIRNNDSVCSMPSTWLMDCASNFAIIDLDWVVFVNLLSTFSAHNDVPIVPSTSTFFSHSDSQDTGNNSYRHLRFVGFLENCRLPIAELSNVYQITSTSVNLTVLKEHFYDLSENITCL